MFGADVVPNCAVFDSETDRFPDEKDRSPGPVHYEPKEPVYILDG